VSLRLRFEMLSPDYAKQMQAEAKKIAHAATAAVTEVAALIKAEGKSEIAAGGMSARFQNAMYAKVFPAQGDSLHPAALVGLKIPYASVFEQGATIPGKPMLWLPLDNAPSGRGGKRMSAAEFVKTVGVLYSINRPGKPPLLAAVVRETDARAKKPVSLRLLKRGRNPGGRGSVHLVPMFVGVPSVTDPQKYNITAIIEKYASQLGEFYQRNWKDDNA
jgi:hypothetical protein